jgi:hypothetical protein
MKKIPETSFPAVWGEGNLFAYSGFEGRTDWHNPFVATLLRRRIGFTIHTARKKSCWLALRSGKRTCLTTNTKIQSFGAFNPEIVAGDIISLRMRGGQTSLQLISLPLSRNTFLLRFHPAKVAKGAMLYFVMRSEACRKMNGHESLFTVTTDMDSLFIRVSQTPDDFAVVDSLDEAMAVISNRAPLRARAWDGDREVRYLVLGLEIRRGIPLSLLLSAQKENRIPAQVQSVIEKRQSFYKTRIRESGRDTLAKALSILKVNVESAQGIFKQRWTTPDRYPHRHLWLWDSCFHACAYTHIEKKLAEDTLTSVLDTQQPDGFIPHIGRPDGDFSNITQPPLLAWAALSVYQRTRGIAFLRTSYPKIEKYLHWCTKVRKGGRNGLLQWKRSDESGMDNSSRFNRGCRFNAIDFSSLCANDLECLYRISLAIGQPNKTLKTEAARMHERIQEMLWNRRNKFFYDRYPSGRFSPYETACGFLPLFSGSATRKQAEHLVLRLMNKNKFSTPLPVPSEAIDSPTFDNNMWRGPVWLNYNYFIIAGLDRYGYSDLAKSIRTKTIREVERWYQKEGTIFEFYDPFARLSPRRIPRKDTHGAIKEFGWSAALYLVMKEGSPNALSLP